MPIELTYKSVQNQLPMLLDLITKNREIVIIHRLDKESVAMIAADELVSLNEMAYLLRSPRNAERFLSALARALKSES